jgi:hypothetical protein
MRRVRIDRLDIHLRNVPAAAAQDAGRLLGPALAKALQGRGLTGHDGADVDAGRLSVGAGVSSQALAAGIAERIAVNTGAVKTDGIKTDKA